MKITKRQLRKIIKEAWQAELEHYYATDEPRGKEDTQLPAYEDNQTKMVRRYLVLRGEESKLDTMSQQEIETLAAELRSYPPSTKKRWGIYDLRENTTKITKRQLRRIIRESLTEGKLGAGHARVKGDVIITSSFGIKNTNQLPARGNQYSVGDLVEYVVKKYKRNRPPKTGQGVIVDRYEKSGIVKVTIIPIEDGSTINRRVSSINRAEEAVLSVVEPGWSPVIRGHSDDPDVDQGQNLTNPNRG